MNFTFKIYLPTLERYSRYKQITNDMYMTLVKYIQNNDDEYIDVCFDNIINKNNTQADDNLKLSKIDKFCVLLNLRILCVSDDLDIVYTIPQETEDITQKIKLNLYDVLDAVTNYNIQYNSIHEITKECKIKLKPPTKLLLHDDKQIFNSVIDTLYMFDKEYDMSVMTDDQKELIVDSLPTKVLTSIIQYIQKVDRKYRIEVFDAGVASQAAGVDPTDQKKYELRMFDNSLFEFLKLCYSDSLHNQYYMRYVMVKHLGYTMAAIDEMSPQDINTFITMYKKELDEERKAMEKSTSPSGSISLPMQNFAE